MLFLSPFLMIICSHLSAPSWSAAHGLQQIQLKSLLLNISTSSSPQAATQVPSLDQYLLSQIDSADLHFSKGLQTQSACYSVLSAPTLISVWLNPFAEAWKKLSLRVLVICITVKFPKYKIPPNKIMSTWLQHYKF